MAKLSARGRTELCRLSKEADVVSCDSMVTWERVTIALMSDGAILRKRDVKFKPASYETEGSRYSYGWTVKGKVKPGVTPEAFKAAYQKLGYT